LVYKYGTTTNISGGNNSVKRIINPSDKFISSGNAEYLARTIDHKNKIPISRNRKIKSNLIG
jgi:hypothetical protein